MEKAKSLLKKMGKKILTEGDLKVLAKQFITENPYPKDEQLHDFCDKQGISPHDLETAVYAVLSDYITGKV